VPGPPDRPPAAGAAGRSRPWIARQRVSTRRPTEGATETNLVLRAISLYRRTTFESLRQLAPPVIHRACSAADLLFRLTIRFPEIIPMADDTSASPPCHISRRLLRTPFQSPSCRPPRTLQHRRVRKGRRAGSGGRLRSRAPAELVELRRKYARIEAAWSRPARCGIAATAPQTSRDPHAAITDATSDVPPSPDAVQGARPPRRRPGRVGRVPWATANVRATREPRTPTRWWDNRRTALGTAQVLEQSAETRRDRRSGPVAATRGSPTPPPRPAPILEVRSSMCPPPSRSPSSRPAPRALGREGAAATAGTLPFSMVRPRTSRASRRGVAGLHR
jgi:hypothetical protein